MTDASGTQIEQLEVHRLRHYLISIGMKVGSDAIAPQGLTEDAWCCIRPPTFKQYRGGPSAEGKA